MDGRGRWGRRSWLSHPTPDPEETGIAPDGSSAEGWGGDFGVTPGPARSARRLGTSKQASKGTKQRVASPSVSVHKGRKRGRECVLGAGPSSDDSSFFFASWTDGASPCRCNLASLKRSPAAWLQSPLWQTRRGGGGEPHSCIQWGLYSQVSLGRPEGTHAATPRPENSVLGSRGWFVGMAHVALLEGNSRDRQQHSFTCPGRHILEREMSHCV